MVSQGRLLAWIKDFLTYRFQRVVLGQTDSAWLAVSSGVPQGSVLGPLLFIVFINDLVINISSFPKCFADETKLICIIKDDNCLAIVQKDLDLVSHWCKTWLMELNESKCKVMHLVKKNPNQTISLMVLR